MSWAKREISLRHSDSPLTSKRVRIILSNPVDAKALAKAIRARRHNQSEPFELTKESASIFERQ